MSLIDLSKKINSYFVHRLIRKNTIYEEEFDFIESLGKPRDDIERSYFQYKCRVFKNENFITITIKNILSFFLLIYLYLKYSFSKQYIISESPSNIFVFDSDRDDILPNIYVGKVKHVKLSGKLYLSRELKKFFMKLVKRYPFSFYFLLHNFLKLSIYDFLINTYSPKKILCSCEYSNTSSILTLYCTSKSIQHINIMHGEIFFYSVFAFARFHQFYIWDSYYVNLLKQMHIEAKFIVHRPKTLTMDFTKFDIRLKEIYDYTFYLQLETEESLKKIKEIIHILLNKKYLVKVRPHPIYSNYNLIEKYFSRDLIEYPKEISIELSFFQTKNIISCFSTTLYQATLMNKSILINDCTCNMSIDDLVKRGYIIFQKKYRLLSSLIEENISKR